MTYTIVFEERVPYTGELIEEKVILEQVFVGEEHNRMIIACCLEGERRVQQRVREAMERGGIVLGPDGLRRELEPSDRLRLLGARI